MNRGDVLFVGHDAARTGAPLLLLSFIRWLTRHSNLRVALLLRHGGELVPEFASVCTTEVLPTWQPGVGHWMDRWRRRKRLEELSSGSSLIYANTITNGQLIRALAINGRPIVTHVHELANTIQAHGPENLADVLAHTHRYVACAGAVRDSLVAYGVAPPQIEVIHEFVDVPAVTPEDLAAARVSVRARLGLSPATPLVGGSGTTDSRKAPDLFVQVAEAFMARWPEQDAHFLWVGGAPPGSPGHNALMREVTERGLSGRVHFIGAVNTPLEYFKALDVFALVSREDPFPLVCLEAAAYGVPTVCFSGAGGMPEFVEPDAGRAVPYLDTTAMADQIGLWLTNADVRNRAGAAAASQMRAHHTVESAAPRLLQVIEQELRRA